MFVKNQRKINFNLITALQTFLQKIIHPQFWKIRALEAF